MSKVDKGEYMFAETLKTADIKEDIKTEISEEKLIATRYGDKRIAVLKIGQQVFLNAISIRNLVEAFGDETDDWLNKPIIVTTELSERTQGKRAVIIKPVDMQGAVAKKK